MNMTQAILAICLCACTFFVFPASAEAKSPAEVGEPEDMIRLSISYSTGRGAGHSFELREENGQVLFSCHFGKMSRQEMALEKVPVDPQYMRRLRDMAKRHGFTRMREKDLSKRPFVHDAPMYEMAMYWPDNKRLRLNYWPAHAELERFFWEIADTLVNRPGAPEGLSALYYDYAHVQDFERFNFSLRTEKGKFLFSARYFTENRDKVVMHNVPVQPSHMQKLREIVRTHGIADKRGVPLQELMMRRSAPPSPFSVLRLSWPDMRFVQLDEIPSGSEELKQFFQNLAEAHSKHWEPTHVPDILSWLTFTCTRENEADSFMFHLREVSASTELMARCFTKEGKKLEFHAKVDPKYMDQLRAIVKKHDLVERLKKMPYAERERSVTKDKLRCVLVMDWWHDPRLRLPEWPASGGDELEAFFRSLAQKYAQ
jgi:hypothetical protein